MADEVELLTFQGDDTGLASIVQELIDLFNSLDETMQTVTATDGELEMSFTNVTDAAQYLTEQVQLASDAMQQASEAASEEAASADESATAMKNQAESASESAAANDEAKGSFAGAGAAMMVMGTMATQAAGNFLDMGIKAQDSFSLVTGMAGESQANMQKYSGQLDALSVDMATNLDQVGNGLYFVESAGYDLAHGGLTVLSNSMRLATASGADQASVASALTAIMHSYNLSAQQSGLATDEMALAVVRGKQSMQAYAQAIGPLAAASNNAKISMEQMNAAEATFTQINPNVRQDTMQLRMLFNAMSLSMDTVSTNAKKLKLNFNLAHYESLDLAGRLQYLAQITGGPTTDSFKKMVGGTAGLSAALAVLTGHGTVFEQNLKAMQNASGTTAKAFAEHQQDISFHTAQLQAEFSVMSAHIVQAITPVLIPLFDKLSSVFSAVADAFSKHADQLVPLIIGLGAALAAVAVGGAVAFLVAMGPVVLVVGGVALAIGALVAGIVILAQHWQQIMGVFSQSGPLSAVGNLFRNLSSAVTQTFNVMQRNAEEKSLQMKLQTAQHTEEMARENIANIREQELRISEEMKETHNASTRHMLQMKLDALKASEEQANGVIRNMEKEKAGVQAQLNQLNPAAKLKDLERKDASISATIEGTQRVIAGYAQQRAGILQELAHTTDAAKRAALERQLADITAAQKQKEGVLKHLEEERNGIEKSLKGVKLQISSEGANPFLQALHNIGSFLQSTFAPVVKSLQQTLKTELLPAWKQLQAAFNEAKPVLTVIGQLLGVTLMVALSLVIGAITGTVRAIAGFLPGLMQAFGGIAEIFGGIVRVVSSIMRLIYDIFTGNWSHIKTDFQNIVQGILSIGKGFSDFLFGLIRSLVGGILGAISGFAQGFIGSFAGMFLSITGQKVPQFISNILSVLQQLPGKVDSWFGSLSSGFSSKFAQLAHDAWGWAGDFINGFVSGITSNISKVTNAVQGIAQNIAKFLHFSSPDTGPLANYEQWMPDFGDGLARGLSAQRSKVAGATSGIATSLAQGVQSGAPGASSGNSSTLQAMLQQQQHANTILSSILQAILSGNSQELSIGNTQVSDLSQLWQTINHFGGVNFEAMQRGAGTSWR